MRKTKKNGNQFKFSFETSTEFVFILIIYFRSLDLSFELCLVPCFHLVLEKLTEGFKSDQKKRKREREREKKIN